MRSKGIDGVIRFRRALKKLITWRGVFDHFILACILTNCLFLALSDPSAAQAALVSKRGAASPNVR